MVWQQGEADARDIAGMEQSRQYSSNLKNFIEQSYYKKVEYGRM